MRFETSGSMNEVRFRHRVYAYFMMAYSTGVAMLLALLYGPVLMMQGKAFEASHGFELFEIFGDDDDAVYRFQVFVGPFA